MICLRKYEGKFQYPFKFFGLIFKGILIILIRIINIINYIGLNIKHSFDKRRFVCVFHIKKMSMQLNGFHHDALLLHEVRCLWVFSVAPALVRQCCKLD